MLSKDGPHLRRSITSLKYDIYQVINPQGETLLHAASREGRMDIIRILVEIYDCRVNVTDRAGNTPLHIACKYGQFSVVAYYFYQHHEVSSDSKNQENMSLLHFACQSSSMPLIRLITFFSISHVKEQQYPKLTEFEDDILFHIFSKNKYLKLSNNFAKVFGYDIFNTPLHVACRYDNLMAISLFFSELNLVLNFDFKQYIPSLLKIASELRHYDIIKFFWNKESKLIMSLTSPLRSTDSSKKDCLINNSKNVIKSKRDKSILYFCIKRGDHDLFKHLQDNYYSTLKVENEECLLHAACMSGDIEMVTTVHQFILKHSPKLHVIDWRDHLYNTCMHIACQWNSLEIMKYLFSKGFKINALNSCGDSPLHIAIQRKSKDVFDFLIKNEADTNAKNKNQETPLHIAACDQTDLYYAQTLLSHHNFSSWNEPDVCGDTPLFNALRTRNKEMITMFLLNPNYDLLAVNKIKGETAANIAGRFQDLELVEKFLSVKKLYPIKLQNYMGQTLVHLACWKNNLDMVLLLGNPHNNYEISEDLNLLDRINELTPLQFACINNDSKLVKYFLNLPDSYPDVKNKCEETVIHICSRLNMRQMAEICVDKCSRLSRNEDFDTPLHVACYKKNYDLLEWLIKGLPDTCKLDSYVNKYGNTILHVLAERQGTEKIIKFLISTKKCDHNIQNKAGNTALHFAFREGIESNAICLLSLSFSENVWYNNEGQSPLLLAIINKKLNFIKKITKYCNSEMLLKCIQTEKHSFRESVQSLDMPLLHYLVYFISNEHFTSSQTTTTVNSLEFIKYPLLEQSEDYEFKGNDNDDDYYQDDDDDLEFDNTAISNCSDSYASTDDSEDDNNETSQQSSIDCNDSYNDLIVSLALCEKIGDELMKLTDSHENTILHYLAMLNYDEFYTQILEKAFRIVDINSLNESLCSPLHYACSQHTDWMIYNIFQQESGFKCLNKKSKHGTPFHMCTDVYHGDKVLQFLAAHGAKIEGNNLRSAIRQEDNFTPDSSVGIIVLGDSTAGKTTLIDTLRMMVTNNRQKFICERKPTTGVVMSEYTYYKNAHCYRFYDYGGQVEFEATHSVHLENLLTLNADSSKNPFVFLLLVKGTDSHSQNKDQIMRWLNFVRGHVRVNTTSVHLILICSHEDKFESKDSRQVRRKALKKFLDDHDTSPLDRHEHPYLLNCTKPDTPGMCQLMSSLEEMFIYSESFREDRVLDELKYYLNLWFSEVPCQVKELIEKIVDGRKFELDKYYGLKVSGKFSKMIIPQEKVALISLLKELYARSEILLLMQPDNDLDWWIVGKSAQNILFSEASSLFSPRKFTDAPEYSLLTYNTGVVPEQNILKVFERLKINANVMINYLINMEFCSQISKHTFDCIVQQSKPTGDEQNDDKLYFFPGLIKSAKEIEPYENNASDLYTTAWIFENTQNWSLRFIHAILVHLTYKFTVIKDDLFFVRRIHLWTNGLFFCTQDQVEVLVEAENTKELFIAIRSTSKFLLAKYRTEILREIRIVQKDILSWDPDTFKGEYVLYPPPLSYNAIDNQNKIQLSQIIAVLKKEPSHRSIFIECIKPISLEKILIFDPCIYLEPSELNIVRDGVIDRTSLPKDILEIPEYKKVKVSDISISDLGAILNKYSIIHDILGYHGVS